MVLHGPLHRVALTRATTFAPIHSSYGRTASYRRLYTQLLSTHHKQSSSRPSYLQNPSLQTSFRSLPLVSRPFHSSILRYQQTRPSDEVRDPPREAESQQTTPPEEDPQSSKQKPEDGADGKESAEGEKEEKKEDLPPPPPHGDKTPWQVFTETLSSEFKASKEWNESTKALASSAHQFTESESVKRARAAYEAASGAASSTTSTALKSTGKVLGQGAAWTWETPVVKGLRAGVNATGRGIEKATRPVRETEVYKTAVGGVKDVIDDGSSSRYGGWVEKEERRKAREAREAKEALASGRPGRRAEKIEEDPKYAEQPMCSPVS